MCGMREMMYTVRIRWENELERESLIEIHNVEKGKDQNKREKTTRRDDPLGS